MILFEDFILRAAAAGIGVALIGGPLGCFIVWRRMAYFGDTMSHAALLGVALGLLFNIEPMIGVLGVGLLLALFLGRLDAQSPYGVDTLLGIFAHASLAIGLVVLGTMETVRMDLSGYLFGDILAVGLGDLIWIYLGLVLIAGVLAGFWRPLLLATINLELAQVEGFSVYRPHLVLILMIALVVAAAMKLVGVLLITALLIIPAAAARPFAHSPEIMAILAAALGCLAVLLGIGASALADTPAGPSIVVAAFVLFAFSRFAPGSR